MNEEVKHFLEKIVEEENNPIPEYGFTIQDYIETLVAKGGRRLARTTARDRLNKLVNEGRLVRVRPGYNLLYYVPKHLAKNAELDEESVLNS